MRSNRVVIGLVVIASWHAGITQSQEKPKVTVPEVRQAIKTFQEAPFSNKARQAIGKIVIFTSQSKKVAVLLGKEETGWLLDKKDKHSLHYMAAYFAGNIEAQLQAKKVDTNIHAGLLEVLKVYQLAKKKTKGYQRPTFEKFLSLQKKGKLKEDLADLQKKRTKELKKAKLKETGIPPAQSSSYSGG